MKKYSMLRRTHLKINGVNNNSNLVEVNYLINCLVFFPLAAIQALKRKKRYEKQLQQIDGTLSTIEMQREALEGANTNTAVLTTMKKAADALKHAHQHMYVIFKSYTISLLLYYLF